MRVLLFLILFSSSCFGQSALDRTTSITFKNKSLQGCLVQLGSSTGINFSYNSKILHNTGKKVSDTFTEKKISEILDQLFMGTPLAYKEIGGQISIYEDNAAGEFYTLSGYVRNKSSKEEIVGARLYFPNLGTGCVSNAYGYYAINLPAGETKLLVSSIGLQKKNLNVNMQSDLVLNVYLSEDTLLLNVVEVIHDEEFIAEIDQEDLNSIGGTTLTKSEVKNLPPSLGEYDIAKYAQSFPGVRPAVGGTANFRVRGLGSGNNLILIDEIPIYHPTHLFGLSSIINTDAIKSAQLFKDYVPANYGLRNSSVFQIRTNEGNQTKFGINGGLSFVSASLNVEGPIKKDVASFYLSGRVSTMPFILGNYLYQNQVSLPNYQDINAKLNFKLNSNNRIYLTGYFGNDFSSGPSFFYNWGNEAASIGWTHNFNAKNFANLSFVVSSFRFNYQDVDIESNSVTQEVIFPKLKYEVTSYLEDGAIINFGAEAMMNTTYNKFDVSQNDVFLDRTAINSGYFFTYEKRLSRKLELKAGIRIPTSFHIGRQDTTTFLNEDYSSTTAVYEKGKLYDFRVFLNPRIHLAYYKSSTEKFDASFTVTTQQTHLIDFTNYIVPIQVWTNSNAFLPPEHNFQLSGGYSRKLGSFSFTTSAFGRYVHNVPDYAYPGNFQSSELENNLIPGHIWAGGFEFMAKFSPKPYFTASASYSYIFSRQKTPGVNFDEYYPTLFSRPHYFNFNQHVKLTKKWVASSNIILHSPTAITLPNGQFTLNGVAYPLFSQERNNQRLPYYARFDISVTRKLGVKKGRDNFWLVLSCQNVFRRYNPAVYYLVPNTSQPDELLIQSSDFTPRLLTLTLNFKF